MKKIYLTAIFICAICFSFTSGVVAQSDKTHTTKKDLTTIQGLQVYPNPAPKGSSLFITSDSGHSMTVSIYSILGDRVLFKVLIGKELDISALNKGVYILKVKLDGLHSSQKLVIN